MTQQTSLAQQLNQLKISQKDEIKLPSRTKLSFLFDIKQAGNIDDQTLYYICQSGLRDLQTELPQLSLLLQDYTENILNEKSLEFYRGTMTKEDLKDVDQQLDNLIRLLAPFLLHNATHRILEYLIRVYEINAYHKDTLIFSFLPYFETSFFLRMIQVLNVKQDDNFSFLEQFAFKGQALDKISLIKSLSRNDSTLFTKYNQFCFDLGEYHQSLGGGFSNQIALQSCLHWKFFGMILSEVLKTKAGQSQTTLFNLLPFISKAMKSEILDFKFASYMGVAQIVCRRSLSPEYAQAFFKQILLSMKDQSSEEINEKAILVLSLIVQYQSIKFIDEKDISILLNVPKLQKFFQKLMPSQDLSQLIKILTTSSLLQSSVDLSKLQHVVFQSTNLDLKLTYLILESTVATALQNENLVERCHQMLQFLKHHNESEFNQALLFILKQSEESKEKIIKIVSGQQINNLVAQFGDKEYSLLTALGSQQKITKINALQSVNENVNKLSHQERDLVTLQLVSLIQLASDEESIIDTVLQVYEKLTLIHKNNSQFQDFEYQTLHSFLHLNLSGRRYSDIINNKVKTMLLKLNVQDQQNQFKKIALIQLEAEDNILVCQIPQILRDLIKNAKQSVKRDELGLILIKNFQHQEIQEFIMHLIIEQKPYQSDVYLSKFLTDYLKVQGLQVDHFIFNHIDSFQKAIKKNINNLSLHLLNLLIGQLSHSLPADAMKQSPKLISKLLSLALSVKNRDLDYSLNTFISNIISRFMQGSVSKYVEFLIQTSIESKNESKRVFCLTNLIALSKLRVISPQFMIITILVCVNSDSVLVRQAAINLGQQIMSQQENGEIIQVFTNTPKPKSARKSSDKVDFTPIKPKPLKSLIKDLLQLKTEILTDRKQLQVALNNSPHNKVIDQIIRSLLDIPTLRMRRQFIEVVSQLKDFTLVFSMSLQEQLSKEYIQQLQQISSSQQNEKAIDEETQLYLGEIGNLIAQVCRKQTSDLLEEHISTLVIPYIQFIFALGERKVKLSYLQEEIIENLFTKIVVKDNQLFVKSQNVTELLKLYIQSQHIIYSKLLRNKIKEEFTKLKEEKFSDKDVLPILKYIEEDISNNQKQTDGLLNKTLQNYEILMELLTQVKIENDYQILPTILQIVKALSINLSQTNSFYLIEISSQVILQIIENKRNSKKNLGKNLDTITEVLNTHIEGLRQSVLDKIENQESQVEDPFKEFIMEIDTTSNKKSDGMKSKEKDQQFTGSFQIISSILNLLSQYEIVIKTNLTHTFSFFEKISQFIQELTQHDQASTAIATNLIFQLFRFYHNQVVRICRNSISKNQDLKQLVARFIDTLLLLQDSVSDVNSLFSYLQKVSIALESKYSTLIVTVLLCHAKDQIQIKDNIQIDSLEVQLIDKLLIQTLTPTQLLQVIEELVFNITVFKLAGDSHHFTISKLNLVFNQEMVSKRSDEANWCQNRYLINQDKEIRRFKYLSIFLINNWISNNQNMQRQLSLTLHEDEDQQDSRNQSHQLFYQVYLTSSIFNESLNHLLQDKEYTSDKKAKKSLKRLSGRVQEFQRNLNSLLSYQVQIDIVMRILEFKDKQTTYLKTQSLQLLINKTPQFSQGLSKIQERNLTVQFLPLIQKCISILSGFSDANIKQQQNSERQNFVHSMFCLLARTFTSILSTEVKQQILDLSFRFLDHHEQIGMILHSQLVLTLMTIFEVQQLDILEHLPRFISHLIIGFSKLQASIQEGKEQDFFENSFTSTLLKACLSLITFFSKFLTAQQFEHIISAVIVVSHQHNSEVLQVLDLISRESSQSNQFKVIFQAIINSYETVIIQEGVIDGKYRELSEIVKRFFDHLLKLVVQRMKKDFCQQHFSKIFLFFKDSFELTLNYFRKNNQTDLKDFKTVEIAIADSFEQFVVKLNEDQLRTILVKLTKWAFKQKSSSAADGLVFPFNTHKTTVFYRCLNKILSGIKEFFVPLLPLYFERTVELLTALTEGQLSSNAKKRPRIQIDFEVDQLDSQHTLFELMNLVCENLRLNFLFDNMAFIQNDTFEKLSDPLSNLVTLESLGNHYLNFIEDTLKPTIFEVVERINNDDMWKKINNELLMHTRHANPMIRLGAFKVVEHLYHRLGERYLVLLNDTIQFLSEGMEDENQDVEATARAIVQRIEQITGDSIHEYLK